MMDLKQYADMKLLTDREKLSFWKGLAVGILLLVLSVEVTFTVIGLFTSLAGVA
jgi:hypothetical protein